MRNLSVIMVDKFEERQIIESGKREIYTTGLDLIFADVINITLVLLIGLFTKTFTYSCIYLLMFLTIRRFSGGFHAKTYGVCRMVTIGTYVLIITLAEILKNYEMLIVLVLNIFVLITAILFAPIPHPNKDLSYNERKANKFFSLVTILLCVVISTLLAMAERKVGLVISLILFAIAVLMYVGMAANNKRKEGNNNNEDD